LQLSVIVPLFNEAKRIEDRLVPMLREIESQFPSETEAILVNDGSQDRTYEILLTLPGQFSKLSIQVLTYDQNQGKGNAVRLGMIGAKGVKRIFVDADHAIPVRDMKRLVHQIDHEHPVVIASRRLLKSYIRTRQPWWRERMGEMFNRIQKLILNVPVADTQCGLKGFSGEAATHLFSKIITKGFAFDTELLWLALKSNYRITEVPVEWSHIQESRVHPILHSFQMLWDLLRVRLKNAR